MECTEDVASTAGALCIPNVAAQVCLFLDPISLMVLALVSNDWNRAVKYALRILEENITVKYFCFKKRRDISKQQKLQFAWPYPRHFDCSISWQRPHGILIFGGIFGTAKRVSRQMSYIEEYLPAR